MRVYYNEIDPYAAQWLRNLIAAGLIPAGDVDERDIRDVTPRDIAHYDQCHFFAGIGGWPLALRLAGYADLECWTGSCPCQPFSSAGARAGFADERHLWPAWHWLIEQCGPAIVLSEQVASGPAKLWIDLVSADLEGLGYAFGAGSVPACGVGGPHIRQRSGFVACRLDHAAGARHTRPVKDTKSETRDEARLRLSGERRDVGRLADANSQGQGGRGIQEHEQGHSARFGAPRERSAGLCPSGKLADATSRDPGPEGLQRGGQHGLQPLGSGADAGGRRPGPVNGFWRDADWLRCRDGFWRPVEPGTFPLADGVPARVGKLRAYGNAIVPEAYAKFIAAAMEAVDDA